MLHKLNILGFFGCQVGFVRALTCVFCVPRFPAEYVLEFQKCLDRTEPVPWDTIRQTVEKDLGMSLAEAFASVDPTPIATASVAQVHAAGEGPAPADERQPGGIHFKLCPGAHIV